MRIFVAGGAGAVGRQLVPMLVAAGHQVTGTTRSVERQEWLRRVGAEPAVVDVFDADALRIAVVDARPDVVVHQLTDLAGGFEPHDLARNRRLRELGTRHGRCDARFRGTSHGGAEWCLALRTGTTAAP